LISKTPWRFKDICLVTIISLLIPILSVPFSFFVLKNKDLGEYLFVSLASVLFLFIPILWAKRYYRLGKESLGIRKGKWSVKSVILISVGIGLGYFLLESVVIGRKLIINQVLITNTLKILLSILSFGGFLRFILAPVSEEVYFRGFLYGYIRGRLGVKIGLCIQALIFSFFHLDFFSFSSISLLFQRILIGLLSGILYEVSDSLYPAMIYHAILIYLIAITVLSQVN